MSKKDKLTPEQEKELIMLAAEIEAEAIAMKMDYDENPSQESGSVVHIHQESPLLDDEDEKLAIYEEMINEEARIKYAMERKFMSITQNKEEKDR